MRPLPASESLGEGKGAISGVGEHGGCWDDDAALVGAGGANGIVMWACATGRDAAAGGGEVEVWHGGRWRRRTRSACEMQCGQWSG